jgi:SAM-dependent methyltransferase
VNQGVDSATGAAAHSADARRLCGWCGYALVPDAGRLSGRLRCGRCGAQTTWPRPTEAELDRAYGSWYRPPGGRFAGLGDRLLRRLRGQLARRLAHIAPPGPVLDVGAGDGALLDALAARGRTAVGLERHSTRDDVRAMDLAEVRERWAAIVFWHSLEHLRDPGAALERAADLLLPDGVIVVAMPNADSIQARVFGDRWLALDLPRHLVHVPASALLAKLDALGMRPERVSYLRGGQVVFGWLHGIVGTLPTRPDLYDAIRKPAARQAGISGGRRAMTVTAGALALPLAVVCTLGEASLRRGGSVYVEARRA